MQAIPEVRQHLGIEHWKRTVVGERIPRVRWVIVHFKDERLQRRVRRSKRLSTQVAEWRFVVRVRDNVVAEEAKHVNCTFWIVFVTRHVQNIAIEANKTQTLALVHAVDVLL